MEWMMAHPWMTLCLLILMLDVLGTSITNICRTIMSCADKKKEREK